MVRLNLLTLEILIYSMYLNYKLVGSKERTVITKEKNVIKEHDTLRVTKR